MKQVVTNHIEKIRHSNEHTKRLWVIGATTIVMCVVIVLWVIYLTTTLPRTSAQKTSINETVQIEEKKISFLGTFVEGVKITSNDLWNSFRSIGTGFSKGVESALQYTSKKKEIIIQKAPPETPFTPNNPEPLEPIQLP